MTNIEIPRSELVKALRIGSSIVAERETIPVLNNMRLSVKGGVASMLFTDMHMWLSTEVPATADAVTATTLPAGLFSRTAAAMEGDGVALALNGVRAVLSSGRARVTLPTLPVDDFPNPTMGDEPEERATVHAGSLGQAINAVAYAAPPDSFQHVQSVHFNPIGSSIEIAAFDGKRMAVDRVEASGAELETAFSLPLKTALTLAKLCEEAPDSEVVFFVTDRLAQFECGLWKLRAKLADARFPNYRALSEERSTTPVFFDPRQMDRALGRLAILADGKTDGVRLTAFEDRLSLTLANHKTGEGVEEVPAAYDGEEKTCGFRLGLLREALRNVGGHEAEMHLMPFTDAATKAEQTRAIIEASGAGISATHFFSSFLLNGGPQ